MIEQELLIAEGCLYMVPYTPPPTSLAEQATSRSEFGPVSPAGTFFRTPPDSEFCIKARENTQKFFVGAPGAVVFAH